MSNESLIPSIIAAAVAAAGERKNEAAWRGKINNAIPAIAAMMNPPDGDRKGSRQWHIALEVLEAAVFTGTLVGVELEESSKRLIVTVDSGRQTEKNPTGHETIRTHRTDNAQGRFMQDRLSQVSPGDEMVLWKAIEEKGTGADVQKNRVLVHFETRPKRTDQQAAARPTQPAPPPERSPEAAAPTGSPGGESFAYMFNELSSKMKLAAVKMLRAEGITFPEPEPEQRNRFIAILDQVVGER